MSYPFIYRWVILLPVTWQGSNLTKHFDWHEIGARILCLLFLWCKRNFRHYFPYIGSTPTFYISICISTVPYTQLGAQRLLNSEWTWFHFYALYSHFRYAWKVMVETKLPMATNTISAQLKTMWVILVSTVTSRAICRLRTHFKY